jgi:16S rRNA (guanine966-N2)-methyltransferase
MKDRVREALFNLIGPAIRGTHAVDLFAGTGALGLEAISRGATRATFIEQHFPTAAVVRQNISALGVQDRCRVVAANVFFWVEHHDMPSDTPWMVFSSPPYDYYIDRTNQIVSLLGRLLDEAPNGSIFAVESDERFDFALLPDGWMVRSYPPALVGIAHKV